MLNENIKILRKHLKFSQGELGNFIGVSTNTINAWETASRPQSDRLGKLCDFFNSRISGLDIKPEDLLRGDMQDRLQTVERVIRERQANGNNYGLNPELEQILSSAAFREALKITDDEIEVLKSIRILSKYQPTKEFWINALLDYRKSK